MGKQACRTTNVAGTTRLLHREVAGTPPVFTGDGKTFAFQGRGSSSTRDGNCTEGEGETTAMMFALLQEQHRLQMEILAAANQQTKDAMLERMSAIIAGLGKALDKENVRPPNTNATTGSGGELHKKTKCPHCKKYVFHLAAYCYELEANASKRWTGWKSVKDATVPMA